MDNFNFHNVTELADRTEINTELLEMVASYIERHPEEFDMDDWGSDLDSERPTLWERIKLTFGLPVIQHEVVGCIACHAVRLSGAEAYGNHPAQAQEILGINYEQANRLFLSGEWPEPFKTDFANSDGLDGGYTQTWIAAQRIRHFITTNGAE